MIFSRSLLGVLLVVVAFNASAADFAKPSPEKAFVEMKIFDAAGHPWRAAREDWDAARQRVSENPEWANWEKQQRNSVDAWMAVLMDLLRSMSRTNEERRLSMPDSESESPLIRCGKHVDAGVLVR